MNFRFLTEAVTQTLAFNNDSITSNNNNNHNIVQSQSPSSSLSSFSSLPSPSLLDNSFSSFNNNNNYNAFLKFIDYNNYNKELFTVSIDALAKAAAITQKSINKKNRKLPTSVVVKQFAFASLPDDIIINNSNFRTKSLTSNNKNNTTIMNSSNCNSVSPKANFTRTNQIIITQTNINQRIKIFLSYYPPRFLALFLLGSLASFVIDHLLTQNNITQYPKGIAKLIDTAAWIPPTCGFSAVLVGSLFPLADYLFMCKPNEFQREWSNVMRCIGGFIGVAYAATKLPWSSNYQVSCTLALISMVLWFLFDRTKHGFIMSALFSSIGTIVTYILVSNGIYSFTHADFFGVRSWIPCILYSSCVCFGAIGRQLMIVPEEWFEDDDVNTISNANTASNTFSNGVSNAINDTISNTVNNNIRNNNNKTKKNGKI